jgi:hypothetical protein
VTFRWKRISDDGLLKEVEFRDGFGTIRLNEFSGYETEKAAIARVKSVKEDHRHFDTSDLVLLRFYE